MKKSKPESNPQAPAISKQLAEIAHIQAMEGNPLTPEELAMFTMFEREGWSHEKRRAYVTRKLEELRCDTEGE